MRLAVFASGNGTNFQKVAEAVQAGKIDAQIAFLFCDNKKAAVLKRAERLQVPVISFAPKEFPSREAYETAVLQALKKHRVDLVILAGYMRIVGRTVLAAYPKKIINIHPSLLPDFPGRNSIKEAFDSGVKETGVTIHFVDEGVDTGPVIAQKKVPVYKEDTLETLEERIHTAEHHLFPEVIRQLVSNDTINK